MATGQKEKEIAENWSDFAASLYDKLTGRGAQITYEFQDLEIFVPAKVGEDSDRAHWKLNGTLNIRTTENVNTESNGRPHRK